jgi:hypothetical protein
LTIEEIPECPDKRVNDDDPRMSQDEELNEEVDKMLYDQMQGAKLSRPIGKIAATPTTNDAPHSKHNSLVRHINSIYFLLVFS